MSRTKLIVAVSLAMALISMLTLNQLPIYASATSEDDGWVEGDYDGSPEEQEEQAQEDWEDAGRPGEMDDDDNENDNNDNDDNDNGDDGEQIFTCSDGSTVTGDEECPATGPNPYCDEVDDGYSGSCFDRYDYSDTTGLYPCKDGSQVSDPLNCESASKPEMDTSLNELGGTASLAPGQVALENKPCLYDTSLPQCAPANGECRDGYGMNEDARCFPEHSKCPDGYHGHEDDESGECIPNNISCSQGYVMTVMTNGGDNCEQKQQISCVDVPFYMTCDGQKKKDSSDSNSGSSSSSSTTKTIVINPSSTTANAADLSNCKLDGSADGILQKFDTAKYQACKLHTNNDKIYYDGFVAGCMQVGNTKLICETVANSNIVMPPAQMQAALPPQPTQAIQPAAVS